jgi:hypothetical protein
VITPVRSFRLSQAGGRTRPQCSVRKNGLGCSLIQTGCRDADNIDANCGNPPINSNSAVLMRRSTRAGVELAPLPMLPLPRLIIKTGRGNPAKKPACVLREVSGAQTPRLPCSFPDHSSLLLAGCLARWLASLRQNADCFLRFCRVRHIKLCAVEAFQQSLGRFSQGFRSLLARITEITDLNNVANFHSPLLASIAPQLKHGQEPDRWKIATTIWKT